MPKFKTKAGLLTPYALACGYVETRTTKEGETVRLEWQHACYFIYFRPLQEGIDFPLRSRSARTLTQARRIFQGKE